VTAAIAADAGNAAPVLAKLYLRYYGEKDEPVRVYGPEVLLRPGASEHLTWPVPATDGQPIFEIGIELAGSNGQSGVASLDWLTWSGAPDLTLGGHAPKGEMWRRQWVEALDRIANASRTDLERQAYLAVNNIGRGLAIHGTRDWADYTVSTIITPHLATACGIAARVQGMGRYYALLLKQPDLVHLVKVCDGERTLAQAPLKWAWNDQPHALSLTVKGHRITATVDGQALFAVDDTDRPLTNGGIALVVEEGRIASGSVRVTPA
jgi:hypothetical protein